MAKTQSKIYHLILGRQDDPENVRFWNAIDQAALKRSLREGRRLTRHSYARLILEQAVKAEK